MSGWQISKVGTLFKVKGGKRLPKGNLLQSLPNQHPYIRITDMKNCKLLNIDNLFMFVPDCIHPLIKNYTVNKGDLILSIVGQIGRLNIIGHSLDHASLTENCVKLIPYTNSKIDINFAYYYLISEYGAEQIETRIVGSTQPKLPIYNINTIEIPVPPLSEQKAIAFILSSLDDKIDLLHRQNETLESIAETLFRQCFVEEAQDDWVHGTLKDEFAFTMGQSPKGSSFNEEQIGTPMFQGNADFGFRFPKERVYTTEPTRFAQKLDTLISVRAPVGAQNMARSKCCIGRGVAAFRHINNPDWYTYTYFKLRCLMDEIKKFNDEGTVFGSISKSDFEKIEVIIPPASIIHNYEIMVKPLNDRVITNCFQIEKLEKLRDTLLPKLMSGEVRVSYTPEEIKQ
ncbi:restriction endonuclease subunit S [Providencia rettgeri]|nr:restriction endonuclease subunit S [Providencia rettgeri]ELL9147930.1 restriction endonuclease subunit S [Providencia rettgeri]ELR5283223.1 restriction endonuclease subunit S [Providencia rettgeri]